MNKGPIHNFDLFDSSRHPSARDHLCFLYDDEADWLSFISIFIKTGLNQGEKCLYLFDIHSSRFVHEALRSEGVEVSEYESSGQLAILHGNRVFGKDRGFSAEALESFLRKETQRSINEGYPLLRVIQETGWVQNYSLTVRDLMLYELKVDALLPELNSCLMVCQYQKAALAPDYLNSLLTVHRGVIHHNRVYKSLYYMPGGPERLTGENRFETSFLLSAIEKEELREQARRNRTHIMEVLLNEAQSAIIAVNEKGLIVDSNHLAGVVFECHPDALLTHSIREYTDASSDIKKKADLNPFGVTRSGEINIRVNGRQKTLNISVVPVNLDGKCVYYASGQDITLQKQLQKDLQESENKFLNLLMNIDQPVSILTCAGSGAAAGWVVARVNPAFEKTTGMTTAQTAGQTATQLYGTDFPGLIEGLDNSVSETSPVVKEISLTLNQKDFRARIFFISSGVVALVFQPNSP